MNVADQGECFGAGEEHDDRPLLPTTQQIDAILPFLERFTAEGFSVGERHVAPGYIGWLKYSDSVSEFVQALYDNGWITPSFDWGAWQDEAQEYVEKTEKIDSADVGIIRKLLTTHVRMDRYSEGHLASVFENGHVVALLLRLKAIRRSMSASEDAGSSA